MLDILDFKTVVFMAGIIAIALSLLMLGVKLTTKDMRGIGNWALAIGLIGLALLVFIEVNIDLYWRIVIGSSFLTLGLSLYYRGVLAFDQVRVPIKTVFLAVSSLVVINIFIAVVLNDEYTLVVFNTIVCVALSSLCAKELLNNQKMHQAEIGARATGYMFLLFIMLTVFRLMSIINQQNNPLDQLQSWSLNEVTFIGCMFSIIVITFGLILMVYERMSHQLSFAAGHDWLTGVMNRGNLERTAARLQARSTREKQHYSILLMDLDYFKKINDQYGHLVGDEVLKKFTKVVQGCIRESDVMGRYGGEEFCVLLPKASESEALLLAERIRVSFEQKAMVLHSKQIKCTVSIGVSDSKISNANFANVFAAADTALYEAKKNGRNQVVCYSALHANSTLILTSSPLN